MQCILIFFKPEDDGEFITYHSVRNLDLFTAGEIFKDILKLDSSYIGLLAFNDMTVWNVMNPGPHIDMLYMIKNPENKMELYATMLYSGLYEQNPSLFRTIHRYTSARGHYTPATLRTGAFDDFDKLVKQLVNQFDSDITEYPVYQEHKVPIYDPQMKMEGLYEWNDVRLNVKSLSYIAMAKAMRNTPQ